MLRFASSAPSPGSFNMFSKGPLAGSCTLNVPSMRFASSFRCMAYSPSPSMRRARHIGERIVERPHVHAAAQRHPCRPAGELGTEAHVPEIEAPHLDVRNGGVAPAPGGMRRALHVHVRHVEAVNGDAPLEERERRPGERNSIGGEPHPLLVGELEMAKREPRREGAPQARELDHASRQLRGDALDHRPAGIGVARDQHQSRQQREQIPPPNPTPTPRS